MANFEKVDNLIKTQIGMECHLSVLESLKHGKQILPKEPTPVLDTDGNMNSVESMKFKISYSRHLSEVDKIETQLKQCYFKYHGQCDDDIEASLEDDPGFITAHKVKDVIKLRSILRTVTFHYRKSEEPIKTLWKANREFINL